VSNLKPERRVEPFILFICLVIAAISGVWSTVATMRYLRARRSAAWPRTTAKVTEWELQTSIGYRNQKDYRYHCRYTFRVNGIEYTGQAIKISPFANGVGYPSQRSTMLSERYQVGTECDVWYNPDDPADAVLEPGTTTWEQTEYMYQSGWILSVAMMGFIAWGVRRKRG
jgi:hypothetical protein